LKARRKKYEESSWPGKKWSKRSGEISSVDAVAKKPVLSHKTLIRGARRYEKRRVWCKAREREERVLILWLSVKCKSSGGVVNSCWPINAHNSVILKTPCII
jgi:hypothetical protein